MPPVMKHRRSARVATTLVTVVTVAAMVLGGASAAQATTSFDAPVAVAGAPTGVGAESIEYGGVLITTVRHEDTTFTIEAFDGTTFSVLTDQFLDAQNFVVWREKLFFSGQTLGGWQLYVYDGVTVTALNASMEIMSENVQQISAVELGLVFTVYFDGQDSLLVSTGLIGSYGGLVLPVESFSSLTSFGGSILGTQTGGGGITQVAFGEIMPSVLGTGVSCDTGAVFGEILYRSCGNDAIGPYLYSTDAAGNFAQVSGSPSGVENLMAFGGKLYFSANNDSFVNVLYSFDGTTFAEIAGSPQRPDNLVVVGDTLMMHFGRYFESPLEGITSFDGTSFAPVMGADAGSGLGSGFGVGVGSATPFNPRNLMTFGGSLYFSGTATALGTSYGFWRVAPGAGVDPGTGGADGSVQLAATGVSAGAASASLMSGLVGGGLLLAGLGFLALRRRGLLPKH
jgi:hypothetical protein